MYRPILSGWYVIWIWVCTVGARPRGQSWPTVCPKRQSDGPWPTNLWKDSLLFATFDLADDREFKAARTLTSSLLFQRSVDACPADAERLSDSSAPDV